MTAETGNLMNYDSNMTFSEVLFGALLAIAAVGTIWVSTTLLIYLYQNMF